MKRFALPALLCLQAIVVSTKVQKSHVAEAEIPQTNGTVSTTVNNKKRNLSLFYIYKIGFIKYLAESCPIWLEYSKCAMPDEGNGAFAFVYRLVTGMDYPPKSSK